jgi:hypothetical protein
MNAKWYLQNPCTYFLFRNETELKVNSKSIRKLKMDEYNAEPRPLPSLKSIGKITMQYTYTHMYILRRESAFVIGK